MDTAIQTVTEIITQRGYNITESDDEKIIGTNPAGEQIVVFTQTIAKFNVDRVKEYISLLSKMKINHCIAIYTDSIISPNIVSFQNISDYPWKMPKISNNCTV